MKKLKALSAAAILGLSGVSFAWDGEQARNEPLNEAAVWQVAQLDTDLKPDTVGDSISDLQADAALVTEAAEALAAVGAGFNMAVALDTSLYADLLDQLQLNERQKVLWEGVVLGYLFKSQSWPHYDNIIGTLNSNRMELEAVLEKFAEYPPEIQALPELQAEFVVPRRFAVVTLEVFYKSLTREQIDLFELYVVNLVKLKAMEAAAAQGAPEDAPEVKEPLVEAPGAPAADVGLEAPVTTPASPEPAKHPAFDSEFGAQAPFSVTDQEVALEGSLGQGGAFGQERLVAGQLPDELMGSAGPVKIDHAQLDGLGLGWSADASVQ